MTLLPNQLISEWKNVEDLLPDLELGDLIEIKRPFKNNCGHYVHWVVYIGKKEGIHQVSHISTENSDLGSNVKEFAAKCMRKILPKVRFDDLKVIAGENQCRIDNSLDAHRRPFPPIIIVERSKQKMGTSGYNILNNNCEHFAKWCRYGIRESEQSLKVKAFTVGITSLLVTNSLTFGATMGLTGFLALKVGQHIRRATSHWSII